MKKYFNYRYLITIGCALLILAMAPVAFAKTISLYEQPKADSKVIGNIDPSVGVVAIFTAPDGNWIKVGDPQTGNVGWIKATDLGDKNFSFNVIRAGTGNNQYQIIQYGNIKPLTPEQISNATKQLELRQQEIQRDIQKMMQDMGANQEWMRMPMFAPIFAVPVKETPAKPPETKLQETSTQSGKE